MPSTTETHDAHERRSTRYHGPLGFVAHEHPLAQRIEFVLDDVLSLVEVKRKDVNIVIDEQSESDDEY